MKHHTQHYSPRRSNTYRKNTTIQNGRHNRRKNRKGTMVRFVHKTIPKSMLPMGKSPKEQSRFVRKNDKIET